MSKIIYMDNAATTPCDPKVLETMLPFFCDAYGSASTIYSLGRDASGAVEAARESVAKLINSSSINEVYFTSCGSESDNWAIFGVCEAKKNKGKHIITTAVEHHAVLDSYYHLEKQGYDITVLPVDKYGAVSASDVAAVLRDDTILVSVMHANNEIGTIMPVSDIGELCRERKIHFHVDAVQSVGHIKVDVEDMKCDSLALSAHKFYGPKGVGAFYLRKGSRCNKFIYGGAQERNLRAGTHNVPGIVGLGKAAELAIDNYEIEAKTCTFLRDKIINGVLATIPDTRLNGDPVNRLPNNVNFVFRGIEGESIILFLDMKGICASSGSACTSGSLDPSHVLLSIGLVHEEAHGSLRLTIGKYTTESDVDYLLSELPPIIERLRMMSPLYN